MVIRRATLADSPAIAALHTDSWRHTYRGILRDEFLDGPIAENRRTHWDSRLSPGPSKTEPFVALVEQDGSPRGFVCVDLDADDTWGALLDNLHVSPQSKGQGLGRRLMAEAARWTRRERPRSRMHLWVYTQNIAACRFYEHLGGTINLRAPQSAPDGSRADAVRYGWEDLARLVKM